MANTLPLPSELATLASKSWERLIEFEPSLLEQLSEQQQAQTQAAFALSDFIARSCISQPSMLLDIWQQQLLDSPQNEQQLREQLSSALAEQVNDDGAKKVLRQFRRLQMVLIAWRDLLLAQAVNHSFAQVSAVADSCVDCANQWLYQRCCAESGTPTDEQGNAQPLVVIGMGKLGGRELNFSSDIDLIFCYPENGETQGGRRSIANQQFFIRMGQRLIQLIDQPTLDGFVFRVDMRLRPFGESGPLAVSYAAFEDYYQHHGRDWERYAMVKARVINQDLRFDQDIQAMLKPYVYRRYIDFSAIQALRSMKAMINSEIRRKGLRDNIKLGSGGIREIEFIVQTFQLIRGGREPVLQTRSLLTALTQLSEHGELTEAQTNMLREHYLYLRQVENILQQIDDQQTQTLPDSESDQQRIAWVMGHSTWEAFYQHLQQRLGEVNACFQSAIGEEEQEEHQAGQEYDDLWHCGANREDLASLMGKHVCSETEQKARVETMYHFMHAVEHRQIGQRGRQTLERMMPSLLQQLFEHPKTSLVLPRVMVLLERILSRTAYLELLAENPASLQQLLRLCAGSAMLAEKLASFPILLDELLDPGVLYNPASEDSYGQQLREFMLRIPPDDMEQQMEALRQFKQIQQLRITAADIAGALPLMKVSDHLTAVAEVIVNAVVEQAWNQMVERHGYPSQLTEQQRGFAVVGYGKIGGIETGYSSDLDLVFLHNSDSSTYTNGAKQIDSKQFYLKLAQRIMHLFNTRTASGVLYELDMRLRPSGASGLLVSAIEAFEQYQLTEAWTWEHQALVRARVIYGDGELAQGFEQVRRKILAIPRDAKDLAKQVQEMRNKMKDHLSRETDELLDLKQSAGGMVDIEFIAQYLVLLNTEKHPELSKWTDNVRIFESCAELGLLEATQAQGLTQCYLDIRDECHRCGLQGVPRLANKAEFELDLSIVTDTWLQLFTR
ncbi:MULTISPECIES: bifunctional [glutamate--ammonia ligase]-adenylyl-L-tyrosine phosphorylase/[glutamate--ammonia-ligase] adenylyltransferase [unclassified Agarivorans]|uniref:bifunctional [glutamate--ammonia ligase]-adenylyl-L-tyrosine phosphorylase/[glutamate--ammonia-ligase] adenylyltransferase n=1 Tax=unclassified Agarivorans TaxID=2636026 RepID=UPI0026E42F51|nr:MULTISPECIES: bifunctional [glutamate--ammonia ligase]-adenylyl-L-tyrosine phosphorylase/[glutamate--ammonia-ligase] adenylyltransferase [unclassified Agarivorans]MDO6685243.1 bifunctional [glutamate--ammonia ligase]-adenylyl-L-tyrosine phosphorylase/[glutamate--ammonia-ligase] adenylyltransferase [Agarivorans sp. 3_MG-2023]MDO6715585.1 bifunctional [glutamate--ammonia ligase]-adenylyl-L-tyrosine phosphorylase/[glutamate--ammonia-ligase] adenylyltransferase [Agarivorans sp. 2_MG-2023]